MWVRGIGVSDRLKGMRTASANLSWSVLSGDRLRREGVVGSGKEKEKVWVNQEAGELLVPPHPDWSAGWRTCGLWVGGGGVRDGEREGLCFERQESC